jgi:hypothetical protein
MTEARWQLLKLKKHTWSDDENAEIVVYIEQLRAVAHAVASDVAIGDGNLSTATVRASNRLNGAP